MSEPERDPPAEALALITARTQSKAPVRHTANIDFLGGLGDDADRLEAWVELGARIAWQVQHLIEKGR